MSSQWQQGGGNGRNVQFPQNGQWQGGGQPPQYPMPNGYQQYPPQQGGYLPGHQQPPQYPMPNNGYPMPPQPPKPKRKGGKAVVAVVLALVAIGVAISAVRVTGYFGTGPVGNAVNGTATEQLRSDSKFYYGKDVELDPYSVYNMSYLDKQQDYSDNMFGDQNADDDRTDDVYQYDQFVEIYTDPGLTTKEEARLEYSVEAHGPVVVPAEKDTAAYDSNAAAKKVMTDTTAQSGSVSNDEYTYRLFGKDDEAARQHQVEVLSGTKYTQGDEGTDPSKDIYGWFQHKTYYVIEHYDAKGKLDKPKLTRVTVKDRKLATPQNVQANIGDDGLLDLKWDKVDGAKGYAIVSLNAKNYGEPQLVDYVSGGDSTEWNAARTNSDPDDMSGGVNPDAFMAVTMTADNVKSADEVSKWAIYSNGNVAVAVYAIGNDTVSVPASVQLVGGDADAKFASLVVGDAYNAEKDSGWIGVSGWYFYLPEDRQQMIDELKKYPITAPYTSADGATRSASTQAVIVETGRAYDVFYDSWLDYRDTEAIAKMGGDDVPVSKIAMVPAGTRNILKYSYVKLPSADYNLQADLDEYNSWSLQQDAQTGLVQKAFDKSEVEGAIKDYKEQEAKKAKEEYENARKKPDSPLNQYTDKITDDPVVQYLMANLNVGNQVIPVDQFQSADEPADVFGARMYDAACMAWVQDPYSYNGDLNYPYYQDGYIVTSKVSVDDINATSAAADSALAAISPSGSDADKVRQINDWICGKVSYDYDAFQKITAKNAGDKSITTDAHKALTGYNTNKVVCDGYASMFQSIALKAGLKSVMVTGDAGGPHAWNLVNIDGTWKGVDVTWNDSGMGNRYLLTDNAGLTHNRTYRLEWAVDNSDMMNKAMADMAA